MRFLSGLVLAGFAFSAQAQPAPPTMRVGDQDVPITSPSFIVPGVSLRLTTDQAMVIVETLGQISCQTVRDLARCNEVAALLANIKQQVKAQGN